MFGAYDSPPAAPDGGAWANASAALGVGVVDGCVSAEGWLGCCSERVVLGGVLGFRSGIAGHGTIRGWRFGFAAQLAGVTGSAARTATGARHAARPRKHDPSVILRMRPSLVTKKREPRRGPGWFLLTVSA